jgi:hypothetical protein
MLLQAPQKLSLSSEAAEEGRPALFERIVVAYDGSDRHGPQRSSRFRFPSSAGEAEELDEILEAGEG